MWRGIEHATIRITKQTIIKANTASRPILVRSSDLLHYGAGHIHCRSMHETTCSGGFVNIIEVLKVKRLQRNVGTALTPI